MVHFLTSAVQNWTVAAIGSERAAVTVVQTAQDCPTNLVLPRTVAPFQMRTAVALLLIGTVSVAVLLGRTVVALVTALGPVKTVKAGRAHSLAVVQSTAEAAAARRGGQERLMASCV